MTEQHQSEDDVKPALADIQVRIKPKKTQPDRGDLSLDPNYNCKTENNEYKRKLPEKRHALFEKNRSRFNKCLLSDVEQRKKLYDRYTLRTTAPSKPPGSGDDTTGLKLLPEDMKTALVIPNNLSYITTETNKDQQPIYRKPIIKTITSRDETSRIFKAVTFVEHRNPKPLQIKIPNEPSKKENLKEAATEPIEKQKIVTRTSYGYKNRRPKPAGKRRTPKKKSPTPSVCEGDENASPPTEVAKWAPSCLNEHTKRYYEAWVDTTLAAVTRGPKSRVFLKQHNILQNFKKSLEWEQQQLSCGDLQDERFTGKISVRM